MNPWVTNSLLFQFAYSLVSSSAVFQLSLWLAEHGMVSAATALTIEAFRLGSSTQDSERLAVEEAGICVASSACRALKELCRASPKELGHGGRLNELGGKEACFLRFCSQSSPAYVFFSDVWKASCSPLYAHVAVADRLALCAGISSAIFALPREEQAAAFDSLAGCLLDSFETIVEALAVTGGSSTFDSGLSKLSTVISVMASLPRVVATAGVPSSDTMQSGCDRSSDRQLMLPEEVMGTLGRAWSTLAFVCENYSRNDVSVS